VIEVFTATLGENTTGVGLEGILVGFNGDGYWLNVKSSLELTCTLSNISILCE